MRVEIAGEERARDLGDDQLVRPRLRVRQAECDAGEPDNRGERDDGGQRPVGPIAAAYRPNNGCPKSSVSLRKYRLFSWQMYSDSSALARQKMSQLTVHGFV